MKKSPHFQRPAILTVVLLVIVPTLACSSLPLAPPANQTANSERPIISPPPTPAITPAQPSLASKPDGSSAARKAVAYLTAHDNIPGEALVIGADYPAEQLLPGRKFQRVTLQDTRPNGQIYKLLVDLETGQVLNEADIAALEETSAAAHRARYGNLEPALYDRLQTLADDETLSVMIWIAEPQGESAVDFQQEAFAALAEKYPEAGESLEQSGLPYLVADQALARRIRAEYFDMLEAEMGDRVRPLVTDLEQQGFTTHVVKGMPAFTAFLPKHVILALKDHRQVGTIYFLGEDPAQANATPPPLPEECSSEEAALAFETIEQAENGGLSPAYEAREPGLLVITRPEEIAALGEGVGDDTQRKLQTIDYKAAFALVVFQGWKPSGSYSVQIKCVARRNQRVNVYVQFQEPEPGKFVNTVVTSPYHLVQIPKVGDWDRKITFNLISAGATLTSRPYFIP